MNVKDEAVLKLCSSRVDFDDELSTLSHYRHANACKVLDTIPDRAVLLLERLTPGSNLKSVSEPEGILVVTRLIHEMKSVALPNGGTYSTVLDLSLGVQALRNHFKGLSGPFKESTLQRVEKILPELISKQSALYLLHGDLHHENILASKAGWKMIDPEGIIGGVEYELMPFLVNNLPESGTLQTIEGRITEFERKFGLEEKKLFEWGLCFSLLSAWWNIEDNIGLSPKDLELIELFNSRIS